MKRCSGLCCRRQPVFFDAGGCLAWKGVVFVMTPCGSDEFCSSWRETVQRLIRRSMKRARRLRVNTRNISLKLISPAAKSGRRGSTTIDRKLG